MSYNDFLAYTMQTWGKVIKKHGEAQSVSLDISKYFDKPSEAFLAFGVMPIWLMFIAFQPQTFMFAANRMFSIWFLLFEMV